MRTSGRRYLALAVLLVLAAASGRADAELVAHSPTTSFPNRYARNICSLAASTAEEMSECQVESLYGTQDGRVNMTFGESSCSVTLKNCVPGVLLVQGRHCGRAEGRRAETHRGAERELFRLRRRDGGSERVFAHQRGVLV